MGKITSLAWILLIYFLLVPGTEEYFQDSTASTQLSVDKLDHDLIPDGNHITTFPSKDIGFKGQLLPLETEMGRIYHQWVSFTSPLIRFCGVAGSLKTTLKRTALFIPQLNSCTLLFPFHSFF